MLEAQLTCNFLDMTHLTSEKLDPTLKIKTGPESKQKLPDSAVNVTLVLSTKSEHV